MSVLYKVCKRTIERELAKGPLTDDFKADMMAKIDLYSAAGKITASEYSELLDLIK